MTNFSKIVRGVAIAANILILVPSALLMLLVAFNIDYDTGTLAGWGALCLISGFLTTLALLWTGLRGIPLIILIGVCSTIQVILLIHGVVETWNMQGRWGGMDYILFIAPTVVVPLLNLWAFTKQDRSWPAPLCPKCGYDMTGHRHITNPACPECGQDQQTS